MSLYFWCEWEDLEVKVDVVKCVVSVWVLWNRWSGIWSCRWVVIWVVDGRGAICAWINDSSWSECVCAFQSVLGVWLAIKSISILWQRLGLGEVEGIVWMCWKCAVWILVECFVWVWWYQLQEKCGLVKWVSVPLKWILVCNLELLYCCFFVCFHFVSLNNPPLF